MQTPQTPQIFNSPQFQAEARQFGRILDSLSAIYRDIGLSPRLAQEAALADLNCLPETLALAA